MTELQKDVVLLSFIDILRNHDSWCGETHIQKGTFLLQELLKVPLGFDFILYKHGPYSFDLKEELTSHLADSLLSVKPRPPYGPRLLPGENCQELLDRFPKTRVRFRDQAKFVASKLGSKNVPALERLATAVFVTLRELPEGDEQARAIRLHELKPHVPLDLAHEAIVEADAIIEEARDVAVSGTDQA